jgi:hypothetical protein
VARQQTIFASAEEELVHDRNVNAEDIQGDENIAKRQIAKTGKLMCALTENHS